MRRYWTVAGRMLAVLLGLFGAAEALDVPLLTDPSPWLDDRGPLAALAGVGLLVVDILLPVPSSLVMVANGAIFGVVAGTTLSLVGSVGVAAVGFGLGRRGGGMLARVVPANERERADRLLGRWGTLAVIATRPAPLLRLASGDHRRQQHRRLRLRGMPARSPASAARGSPRPRPG